MEEVVCLSDSGDESLPPIRKNTGIVETQQDKNTRPSDYLDFSSDDSLDLPPLTTRIGLKTVQSRATTKKSTNKSKRNPQHTLSDSSDADDHLPDIFSSDQQPVDQMEDNIEWITSASQPVETPSSPYKVTSGQNSQNSQHEAKISDSEEVINVEVDVRLMELLGTAGDDLLSSLDKLKAKYQLKELKFPQLATWTSATEDPHALVVWNCADFVNMVAASSGNPENYDLESQETISERIKRIRGSLSPETHLTIHIMGTESYIRKNKSKKNAEYRAGLNDDAPAKEKQKRRRKGALPLVTDLELQEALIEVQLEEKINCQFVESSASISQKVVNITSAIIQAPLKRRKYCLETFSWYVEGDNTNTVKLDREGKGLLRLWQQHIMQFNNVSKDIAQSIVQKYSSPTSLIKAYRKCGSQKEGEKLLENIEVRRGFGPTTSVRRVGPELSRKIFTFLMSFDETVLL